MFSDEKIDYTNYLKEKPQETDPAKLSAMKAALFQALKARDIHGHVSTVYYTDGCVEFSINGMFDTATGKFFSA